MLARIGPFVPDDLRVTILFHFGPEDGHTCNRAQFDWYINDKFQAFLNFNNAGVDNGRLDENGTAWEGPFNMDLKRYLKSDLCAPFDFSFVCKYDGCHEGAAFDFTWSTGAQKTWRISTGNPTKFTVCELSTALSDAP